MSSPEMVDEGTSHIIESITDPEIIADGKLANCIAATLRRMTFGDWCLLVAGEPESMALLVIGCAVDVVVHRGNY